MYNIFMGKASLVTKHLFRKYFFANARRVKVEAVLFYYAFLAQDYYVP